MFGECFDFAPAPLKNARKASTYLPSVAPVAPQLTPREQANKLADSVGIEHSLLDGIPLDMLNSASAKNVKFAMHVAATSLQSGAAVADLGGDAVADFLKTKISMLPLMTRFPLMEEWCGKQGYAADRLKRQNTLPAGGASFLSFDDGSSASASAVDRSDPLRRDPLRRDTRQAPVAKPREPERPSRQELRRREREAAARQAQAEADAAATILPNSLGDVVVREMPPPLPPRERPRAPSPEPDEPTVPGKLGSFVLERPRPVPPPGAVAGVRLDTPTSQHARNVAKAFLADVEVDRETQSAAARREQDAKNHASTALRNFEKTCAAVQAGVQAARKTKDALATSQPQSEDARAGTGSVARDSRDGEPPTSQRRERSRSHDGRRPRPRQTGGRDNEAPDGRGGRALPRDDSRSPSYDSRGDADPGRYRSNRRAVSDSRSWSRGPPRSGGRRPRQAAQGRRPGDDGRRGAPARSRSRRRRLASEPPKVAPDGQPKISASDFDKKPDARASGGRSFTETLGVSAKPTVGAKSSALAAAPLGGAAEKASTVAEPPLDLRQLACRNGWAEFVDKNSGQHWFKNVLSGEMTKTKPKEYDSLISDQANQRRLAWLANHAAMRSMGMM